MTSGPIPYDIVYCTSEDASHPITNLIGGNPEEVGEALESPGSGWQSVANGKVPQTIVLRFPGVVWLQQLRILSHESKIASKVEVRVFKLKRNDNAVGDDEMAREEAPSFRTARFTKLGTVDFSDNAHSQFKAKERKTVHLKTEAYFVKLLFDKPYVNAMNPMRQIGLYAIECIGYVVSPVRHHMDHVVGSTVGVGAASLVSSSNGSSVRQPAAHSVPSRHPSSSSGPSGGKVASDSAAVASSAPHHTEERSALPLPNQRGGAASQPATSLAVTSPTSPQARSSERDYLGNSREILPFRSVRILEFEEFFLRRSEELLSLKEQAIAVEDFETATQCRDKLSSMNQHSRRVYQLEQDKVQAIIEEDFDRAKSVRDAMDAAVELAFAEAKLPEPRLSAPHAKTSGTRADAVGHDSDEDGEDHGRDDNSDESLQIEEEEEEEGNLEKEEEKGGGWPDHHHPLQRQEQEVHGRRSGRERGSVASHGSRYNEDSPVGVAAEAGTAFDDRPVGGGAGSAASLPAPRSDSIVDELQVSRVDPGETVLRLQNIPEGTDGTERLVSREILSATGEEESDTVVFANVNLDLRQLLTCVGQFPTACLVSRRFKLREAALTVLTEAMHDHYRATAAHVEDAVLRFLDYNGFGLQDTIPNVVFAACTFVRMTLFDECGVLSDIAAQAAALLPRLLTRAADPLPRVREEAVTTLTLYVRTAATPLPPFVAAVLADPMDRERRKVPPTNPRAQLARLTALQVLLDSGRASSLADSVTTSLIHKLLIPAVNHPNVDVRDLGTTTFRRLIDVLGVTLRDRDMAKINNAAIKDALGLGKGPKRS